MVKTPHLISRYSFIICRFCFFGATSLKFLQGGWFPVLIGISAFTVMITWKRGREILFEKLNKETMPLNLFVNSIGAGSIQTIEGTAIFMTGTHQSVPHALLHNIKHNKILHERNILLTLQTKDIPVVMPQDRLKVEQISPNFWLMTGCYGFKEQPDVPELLELCAIYHELSFDMMDTSFSYHVNGLFRVLKVVWHVGVNYYLWRCHVMLPQQTISSKFPPTVLLS